MNQHRFTSMGCEIVVGGGGAREHAAIERLFEERERTFSRFIAGSELNRVNARAGRTTLVSGTFAEAVRVALSASVETGGLVDPSLGAALLAAGYDRDFAELDDQAAPADPPSGPGAVAVSGRVVRAGPGIALDLNGVVKSMAVDDALALPGSHRWVSAGGDVATREPLTISLPAEGAIELRSGALATSGSSKRRWLRAGRLQHHLIDPRTGRPAETPWTDVTACGATCVAADVAAKAAFLLGADGPAWLDAREIPGRFVAEDGTVRANETWARSVREAVCT
jgi:thiamine biosynthesis lipoprotein